jgi:hypothetical protein
MKVAVSAVAVLLVSGLLLAAKAPDSGPAPSNELIAKKFVLVDEHGKAAGVLTCNERGPILEFGGDNTKTRLRIFCRKDGGAGFHIVADKDTQIACVGRTTKGEAYELLQVDGHVLDITVSEIGVVSEKH